MLNRNDKTAFTLAETLITLVVVGIVAALTVPTLITKYQKEQTVTKLKKVYSTLAQAIEKSIAENGPINSWETPKFGAGSNESKKEYVQKYLYKYLRVSKNCYSDTSQCSKTTKKFLKGNGSNIWNIPQAPEVILEDGTQIYMAYHSFLDKEYNNKLYIVVDINADRKPNTIGKDTFIFTIDHNGFKPFRQGRNAKDICKNGELGMGYGPGMSCAAVIIQDGWKISDDYPW